MFSVYRFLAFSGVILLASPAASLAASADKCNETFYYRTTVSGAFLMACSVAEDRANPVQYSFDEAVEVCEESHESDLAEVEGEWVRARRQHCLDQGCSFDHVVVDLVDCSLSSGYAYCNCGGSLDCREAQGGSFSGPLNLLECRAAVGAAYGNSVRMVRGCEGRAEGGSIYAFGWCTAPATQRAMD